MAYLMLIGRLADICPWRLVQIGSHPLRSAAQRCALSSIQKSWIQFLYFNLAKRTVMAS